jgi:hypothetical protein
LFVANFLGHPKINVVTARMHDGMLLPFGLPVPRVLLDGKTENVLMGVRPESIEISSAGHYAARVVSSEYMGDGYVIELDYKDNRLTVSQCATPFGEGEPVKFSVERQSLLAYLNILTEYGIKGILFSYIVASSPLRNSSFVSNSGSRLWSTRNSAGAPLTAEILNSLS